MILREAPSGRILMDNFNPPPEGIPNRYLDADGNWTVPGYLPGEELELWIDNTPNGPGSDRNPGTLDQPFFSLDAALERAGFVWAQPIRFRFANSGVPYEADALQYPRQIRTYAMLDGGEAQREVVGATPVDSQTGLVISCATAAPGWTVDAYRGLHCEMRDASGAVMAYRKVARNTSNSVTILAPFTSAIPTGGSIRITRPAVRLFFSKATTTAATPIYGVQGPEYWQRLIPSLIWKNLQLEGPSGVFWTQYFTGNHAFIGTLAQSDVAGFGASLVCTNGYFWSGRGNGIPASSIPTAWGLTNAQACGFGLSLHSSIDIDFPGVLHMARAQFFGSYVGSPPFLAHGSQLHFEYGFSLAGGVGPFTDQRYRGLFSARFGSVIRIRNPTFSGAVSFAGAGKASDTLPMFYCDADSLIDVDLNTQTLQARGTTNFFAHARGPMIFDRAPVAFENAGDHLVLATGLGNIDLRRNTYATLGNATIGAVNPLTRVAGAWSVGNSVASGAAAFTDLPRDGAPAIYRSI